MLTRLALLAALTFSVVAQQPADVLARGLKAFSDGRFAEAEAFLRQAAVRDPRSFEARLVLGATLAQLERPADAIEPLEQAHHLRPSDPAALKLLASQLIAVKKYARVIALLAPLPAPDEEAALLLIESYQGAGDGASSFALAQRSAARFPSSAPVKCWLGFQLQFAGRYDEARKYLEEVLRLAPDFAPAYSILADTLAKQQRPADAIPYFEKAIRLNPEDMDARIGLSHAQMELGDPAKAAETLRDAVRAAPRDARAHLQLSRLCFRIGDEECARREADLSLELRGEANTGGTLPSGLRTGR